MMSFTTVTVSLHWSQVYEKYGLKRPHNIMTGYHEILVRHSHVNRYKLAKIGEIPHWF